MIKKSAGERNHSDYLPIFRSKELNEKGKKKNNKDKRGYVSMKAIKKTIIFLSLLMCFGFLRTNNVNAATGMVKLKPDKTYKDYDVTGNGKKEKICIQR